MEVRGKAEKRYYEVSLKVSRERQDRVCDYIIEILAGGVVIEDVEDESEVGLKFYVPEEKGIHFKKELADFVFGETDSRGAGPEAIRSRLIADIEWVQAYKESIQAVTVGDIYIRPPWKDAPGEEFIDIIIEPKMAFGTGSHETTRLCLAEINNHFRAGQRLFDLGCGSGILSILAAKKGAQRVKGVDIDVTAVANARENIVINNVADKIEIEFGSIEKARDDAPYDFLVANLIKSSIVDLYDIIREMVVSGGIIVLSGLLLQDREDIDLMLRTEGDGKFEAHQDGQWLAYTIFKR